MRGSQALVEKGTVAEVSSLARANKLYLAIGAMISHRPGQPLSLCQV